MRQPGYVNNVINAIDMLEMRELGDTLNCNCNCLITYYRTKGELQYLYKIYKKTSILIKIYNK